MIAGIKISPVQIQNADIGSAIIIGKKISPNGSTYSWIQQLNIIGMEISPMLILKLSIRLDTHHLGSEIIFPKNNAKNFHYMEYRINKPSLHKPYIQGGIHQWPN